MPKVSGDDVPRARDRYGGGARGYFYACVNCGKREDAEDGVQYLCKERPSSVLIAGDDHQFRENPGRLLEEKQEVRVGEAAGSGYGEEATVFV